MELRSHKRYFVGESVGLRRISLLSLREFRRPWNRLLVLLKPRSHFFNLSFVFPWWGAGERNTV